VQAELSCEFASLNPALRQSLEVAQQLVRLASPILQHENGHASASAVLVKQMPNHVKQRADERYGNFNTSNLLKKIQDGWAKLVCFGHLGRLIYDVPVDSLQHPDVKTVRVVVDAEKKYIVSFLPPQSKKALQDAKLKKQRDDDAKRKRDHYKRLSFDQDDEDGALTLS